MNKIKNRITKVTDFFKKANITKLIILGKFFTLQRSRKIRMTLADLKIPYLLVAALSLLALAPMPYGYYIFLRIAVTGCAGMTAYLKYQAGDRNLLLWACVAVAILFNPVISIHLTREIWMVFNIFVAGLFGYLFLKIKKEA